MVNHFKIRKLRNFTMKTFALAAIAGLAAAEMTAEMSAYMDYISTHAKSYANM